MKKHPKFKKHFLTILSANLGLAAAFAPGAHAGTWTGGSGSWSSNASPGWNGTGVPNGTGAVAQKTDSTTATITNDVSGVVIGTASLSSASSVTFTLNGSTNPITFNQDGAGGGTATISNSSAGGSSRLVVTGTTTLADDILISNTSNSTNSQGSITINSGAWGGTGNVTFSNVSNNLSAGQIVFGGNSGSFVGNVTFQKGAYTYIAGGAFGNSSNAVTLGSSGNSTTVVNNSANLAAVTTGNSFTVAATTGTTILGSSSTTAFDTTFTGGLLLNGNLTLTSAKSGTNATKYTGVISGTGDLTVAGTGRTQLGTGSASLVNTYTGNTTLTGTSTLILADNAELSFVIGASGINNFITGSGQTLQLDGNFNFDLTSAATTGSWTIVDVSNLNETFSSLFTVNGFTEVSDVWTKTVGSTTYTFTEATGMLTAVPEPSTYALVASGLASLVWLRRRKFTSQK